VGHFITMLNAHKIVAAAVMFAFPVMCLQAQPTAAVDGSTGYDVACSVPASTGLMACEQPPAHSCDAEASYASQPSRDSTEITLVNRSDNAVKVYWLNFQGQRILYQNLPPGGGYTQQTFIGHTWMVTTLAEQCIRIFATVPQPIVGDESASIAPPAIPDYEQPPPPEDNLIWTPGYWAWDEDAGDYYWVPGTWVEPPIVGYEWTPGYWFAQHGGFVWRTGYWGTHIGFYGGINYGYGYFGRGFVGGSWRPASNNASIPRVSYNGAGGSSAQPNAAELAAATEYHIPPTAAQLRQLHAARNRLALRAAVNNGRPPIGATSRPAQSSNGPLAPTQHGGTLSIVHSSPQHPTPPHPSLGTGSTARDGATAAQNEVRTSSAHAAEAQAHVTQAPVESHPAPQEIQQPRQNPPKAPPRTAPHAEAH
jgi:hypothetical protein